MWAYIKIFLQHVFFVALLEAVLVMVYYLVAYAIDGGKVVVGSAMFGAPIILDGFMVLASVRQHVERVYFEEETVPTAAFVAQVVFEVLVIAAVAIAVGLGVAFLIN